MGQSPYSAEQTNLYLKRIGYEGDRRVSRELLDELIWLHQLHVPFETLDPHDFGKEVSLKPDDMFDKIVIQQRGGHCIETNSCFCRLLRSLGFEARPCLARVLFGSDEFTHPFDHRPTLVTLEGKILFCDVGIGGPMPSAAVEVDLRGWQELRADCYAVRPSRDEGWFELLRRTPSGNHHAGTADAMNIDMVFSLIHAYETDYVFLNYYMTHHPEALHKSTRIVNIRTTDGFRMIWNDKYKEYSQGELLCEKSIDGNLHEILREKFGISC